MTHEMNLRPEPFEKIRTGAKTIELRLYDEKRRKIRVGDTIIFTNTKDEARKIEAVVKNLYIFESFGELFQSLPLLKCGYTAETVKNASPADMNKYYSRGLQKKYKALGIEIEVKNIY